MKIKTKPLTPIPLACKKSDPRKSTTATDKIKNEVSASASEKIAGEIIGTE